MTTGEMTTGETSKLILIVDDDEAVRETAIDLVESLGYRVASAANGTEALRLVIDVGDWDRSRFALPGGQSGNPLSPHYADQLRFWRIGKGVPIAWSEQAVRRAVRETLRLTPA